jgi:outer membrane protein TolC
MMTRLHGLLCIIASLTAVTAAGQAVTQPVSLADLQAEAVARDPRSRQVGLLAEQTELRLRNIAAENLPAIALSGQAQYQSTVATIPVMLPGVDVPRPPRDTYDASIAARQRLFDPSAGARRTIERAQLAEAQARVRSAQFALRQNVSDAFFQALNLQSQRREIEIVITDLEAQLRVATQRVREGTALPSEARILEAELLRRRQAVRQLDASSNAALEILRDLTGRAIPSAASLSLPEDANRVAEARRRTGSVRARPEYEQFDAARELLERQRAAIAARELPRVSAFARAGYGRPGLNPLASRFDDYWLAGIQLEWSPLSWGTTGRDRQVLSLQQQIVDADRSAFADALKRATVRDLADMDRLESSLAEDERIVELREAVMREARARHREGVITSAEYVDRQTDVLAARLAMQSHRVELAEARARFLTTLGLEVR